MELKNLKVELSPEYTEIARSKKDSNILLAYFFHATYLHPKYSFRILKRKLEYEQIPIDVRVYRYRDGNFCIDGNDIQKILLKLFEIPETKQIKFLQDIQRNKKRSECFLSLSHKLSIKIIENLLMYLESQN